MDSLGNNGKQRNCGKKRKRESSDSSREYDEVLPDNVLEMEKNLHVSALKNNMDETCVRKILKKVVTNDHVLALVKFREAQESDTAENSLQPKLTRAKVKELMKVSPKAGAWDLKNLELTPIKHIPVKTRPEVKALIAQELPDDEDDEEYKPTADDVPSDDDHGLESCSDLDSQPQTPATPRSLATSRIVQDDTFKMPQDVSTPTRRKLNLDEEATIARRTRSKLSLSATSIEHIESTFVPPDELPMPAVDDLWNQFLTECLDPASNAKHEDDDETDPEYNAAADPDANDDDAEALGNGIIKISKKELNDLVTELFNIMPEQTLDQELRADNVSSSVLTEHNQTEPSIHWEGKQEPLSEDERRQSMSDRIKFENRAYSRVSIGKTEATDEDSASQTEEARTNRTVSKEGRRSARVTKSTGNVSIAVVKDNSSELDSSQKPPPPLLREHVTNTQLSECVTIEIDNRVCLLPEQIAILQQQLRQHIQLATSNYLQLYVHPILWRSAPPYKEYLETLGDLGKSNATSIVNVCNLKPAIDLVDTWQKTVSANTPENNEMVNFILKESERCRRRYHNNGLYLGEFHETFKDVVANSPVFLYPYLLPPMPYRTQPCRRYAYTRSEDELIALGLDQFWDYIINNPTIYKLPVSSHPRHRRGLSTTVQLMVKHMFPWVSHKVMLAHVQFVRRMDKEKENPITQFFETRTITPVKHKLLPFNPKLTLYEQPEHEVPRIWVRHLSKTSRRFRNYLLRRTHCTGIAPVGVEVNMGQAVAEPSKAPLPIDFTKEIVCNRINMLPKTTKADLTDKFDVQINTPSINNGRIFTTCRLVETSNGAYLVPLSNATTTVGSNIGPITTSVIVNDTLAEENTEIVQNNSPEHSDALEINSPLGNIEHCSCCILLRKICKQKQTVITDFFKLSKPSKTCYCNNIKHPKITSRLKMLVSHFRSNSISALQVLDAKLKILRERNKKNDNKPIDMDNNNFDLDDFAFVTSFHLKLLTRLTSARDTLMKRRVATIIARFNPNTQNPIELTKKLNIAFGDELIDMYKEFLCFLTPEQADVCEAFRDYFVRNCVQDLIKRAETQVTNQKVCQEFLQKLNQIFYKNFLKACEICSELLMALQGYPELAKHVFSLFPHRKETSSDPEPPSTESTGHSEQTTNESSQDTVADNTTCDQSQGTMEYEADHSSSEEEEINVEISSLGDRKPKENEPSVIKNEINTSSNEIKTEHTNHEMSTNNIQNDDDDDSSDTSMTIVEEESIKTETVEWKRDEDKLILEVLKEHLSPEERKDKTIIEIIDEKNIIDMIANSLIHKSKADITNRVLYLLQILLLSEK